MKKWYSMELNSMEWNYVRTYIDCMNRHNSDVKWETSAISRDLLHIEVYANEDEVWEINKYIDTVTSEDFMSTIMDNNSL